MVMTNYFLIFAALLFAIGMVGILINRQNIIVVLMCLELILLAVNTNFITFSHAQNNVVGEVFVFFILTVAAAEAAIGLAIVMLLYRNKQAINTDIISELKG